MKMPASAGSATRAAGNVPWRAGPTTPLPHPHDEALDRPRCEQAAVERSLDVMQNSGEPVVLSLVGSARVPTAAYHRNPELVRTLTRAVVLNAGSSGGTRLFGRRPRTAFGTAMAEALNALLRAMPV